MRRIALALVVAVLAGGAGTAAAGTTTQQQVKDLTAQVKALQASVKKLQADVKKLQAAQKKQDEGLNFVAGLTLTLGMCEMALTADAVQGTWAYIDQLMVATGKPVVFGPQSVVNDYGACAAFTTPITHTIATPPTVSNFAALITLLHG